MTLEVTIREGESQESLLRRFQRNVQMDGILREAKSHRHFISKGETARLKAKNSARRRRQHSRGDFGRSGMQKGGMLKTGAPRPGIQKPPPIQRP